MFVSLNVDIQLSFILGSCLFPSVLDEKKNHLIAIITNDYFKPIPHLSNYNVLYTIGLSTLLSF